MLQIQEYLRSGKTLDNLTEELGIIATHHGLYHPGELEPYQELPLVILNYNQIESPKTHPIVRECRGLTLNKESWDLVHNCMRRFFNWGEVADEMASFDWSSCTTQEKADGSLIHFYFFNGEWHVNTRGSFAYGPMFNEWSATFLKMPIDFTWRQGILKALGVTSLSELNLDPAITYVCEFCSLWNKVVREYPDPCVYLLTRFAGEEEIGPIDVPCFRKLETFPLTTAEECEKFVNSHPQSTFEGVVAKDAKLRRWKLKNLRYSALHRLKGNGDALYRPHNLMPYILAGDDEILVYYPEVKDVFKLYKDKVDSAYQQLESLWQQTWQIENQKDFALSIVGKTPFTGLLFTLRKMKGNTKELRELWRGNEDGILKVLF